MGIYEAKKKLREYIYVDKKVREINQKYMSDFDKLCEEHISAIEIVLNELEKKEEEMEALEEEKMYLQDQLNCYLELDDERRD